MAAFVPKTNEGRQMEIELSLPVCAGGLEENLVTQEFVSVFQKRLLAQLFPRLNSTALHRVLVMQCPLMTSDTRRRLPPVSRRYCVGVRCTQARSQPAAGTYTIYII